MSTQEDRQQLTVVVIDDDANHLELVTRTVRRAYERESRQVTVVGYHNPETALAELPTLGETMILLDYRLGESTGLQWVSDFVREDVGPVVMLTSSGDERVAAEAFRHGVSDYRVKDTFLAQSEGIVDSLNESLRRFRVEQSNRDLRCRLKRANIELGAKNERLAQLTQTAHQFVDDVAHEFRTPLAVIMEFASIIADGLGGPVTEDQKGYLGFISNATRDLADLVDDFLDSGKLQSRTLRVSRQPHDLADLITEALPMLQSRARARDIELRIDVPGDIGRVHVDAEKVRRVLVNLVVNALKFSAPGDTVVISAAPRIEAERGEDEVVVSVSDHGPGMPEEELGHLFERFRQGAGAGRIATRGFGLGLNIVQALVDVNLGVMDVQSTLGEGSTFSFSLPRCTPEAIVASYARNVRRRSERARLTLFRLQRPGDDDAKRLQSFLDQVSHPSDVQIRLAGDRPLHMLVQTDDPEQWRADLLRADRAWRAESDAPDTGPLTVEDRGSWILDQDVAPILEAMQCTQELSHDV